MSGQDKPATTPERADRTSDSNVEAAVEDTFPASDPVATTASGGARAAPPEDMMRDRAAKPQGDTATLTARFNSAEAAKLALEALVRDGPVDRRCAEIEHAAGGDAAATVRLSVPRADQGRLGDLLRRQPGRAD